MQFPERAGSKLFTVEYQCISKKEELTVRNLQLNLTMIFAVVIVCVIAMAPVKVSASSWSQEFNESVVGQFDTMALFMKTGGVDFTGVSGFTDASWSANVASNYIMAAGNSLDNLNFSVDFSNSTPFSFDFFAISHTGPNYYVDAANAAWTGSGWNIYVIPLESAGQVFAADSLASSGGSSVPEPATMSLFGCGLIGLAFLRKRVRG